MKTKAIVAGVGMTSFGRRMDRNLKSLAAEAILAATRLGGRIPVSTSGGLLRKGHPIGATGIAQVVELTEQLQRRSGDRQVEGATTVGLAENGGGFVGDSVAALSVTIPAR